MFATMVAFGHGGSRCGFSVVIGLKYSVGAELGWCSTALRSANDDR